MNSTDEPNRWELEECARLRRQMSVSELIMFYAISGEFPRECVGPGHIEAQRKIDKLLGTKKTKAA